MSTRLVLHRYSAGVLIGAILTFAFAGLATSIALLADSPQLMLLLNTLAFVGVGFMTLQLGERTHVLDPAIGAGGAVLLFSAVQVALVPALRQELGSRTLQTSLLVSVALAFSFAWLGGLVATGGRNRKPPQISSSDVALADGTHHLLAAAQPIPAPLDRIGASPRA
jgi:hypothetical protein